jgi:hypothetical protein
VTYEEALTLVGYEGLVLSPPGAPWLTEAVTEAVARLGIGGFLASQDRIDICRILDGDFGPEPMRPSEMNGR